MHKYIDSFNLNKLFVDLGVVSTPYVLNNSRMVMLAPKGYYEIVYGVDSCQALIFPSCTHPPSLVAVSFGHSVSISVVDYDATSLGR